MSLLHIITSIPLNVYQGSGCYIGTRNIAEGLRRLGARVNMVTPRITTPVYAATRILFNESLRWRRFPGQMTIGIDADGYSIAGGRKSLPHVACIKGVLGDALPYESGATRASMSIQASLEARHARRADLVITISRYCAHRIEELYRVKNAAVVPELIDLKAWDTLFSANPASPDPQTFTVLCVCRFYRRKRLELLLEAALRLRNRIPRLQIRIVGSGPESRRLQRICAELDVASIVRWRGDLSVSELAAEYNRADVFCLPSVQEGFGIVFLEAMAAGRPIVAARSAAVPEVVRNGLLVEPGNSDALAEALYTLYCNPDLRHTLGSAGCVDVRQYDIDRIAPLFLSKIANMIPELRMGPWGTEHSS